MLFAKPLGGWLSDKLGGARVTQWDTVLMIVSALGAAALIKFASAKSLWDSYSAAKANGICVE